MNTYIAFIPSGTEWLFVFAIFFLLFGSSKLPDLARSLGRSIGEFKKAKQEVENEIKEGVLKK